MKRDETSAKSSESIVMPAAAPSISGESTQTSVVRSVLLDSLKGVSTGLAIALTWVVLALVNSPGAPTPRGLSMRQIVVLALLLCAAIAAGLFIGNALGGTVGACWGAAAGYLITFACFGIWIQRTVGWPYWSDAKNAKD